MIQGVIFDMDGVLVDNRDAHIEAFRIICEKYGVPFDPSQFMHAFGMTNDLILKILMPDVLRTHDWRKIAVEKEEIYRAIFEKSIAPAKGLVDFLKALKAAGYRMAVGSSGNTPNVNFVLNRCGITEYFDQIANGDMITHGKPDPEVYLLAAQKLGFAPEACVVVEDAPVGIQAARRAGAKVVAIASTFEREQLADYDLLIDNFTQITPAQIKDL
ncbi:MAG: HAD family phosphatase [Alistipes sp.]|nr:HAD family phosphatase [Alistipes sp.]